MPLAGAWGTMTLCVASAPAGRTAPPEPASGDVTIGCYGSSARGEQLAFEAALRDAVSPGQLRLWHDLTSSHPHVAGTPGDAQVCDRLEAALNGMGLNVERHEIEAYIAFPVSAAVSIVAPDAIDLPVTERVLAEDPYTSHADLTFGWNAYSGSGEATGEVVYANYGTKEDFALLRELGVDCAGRVVIARYGGNYRGYKAKFAQQAGAAGLLIYTDPKDSGPGRGAVYPEGGWANGSYIQRGSILTLDYPGDPLTPFEPAERGAERLDPGEVALPTIPVQPIGWEAAEAILSRMKGEAAPPPWSGGLPIEYRVTGGADLVVRVSVEQERRLATTWNIIATLPGTDWATERIIIGAHHDAWSFGAGDPNCGSIAVLEAARCFSDLARRGLRPRRSILFALWGAEEFGIIGSTEWVESRAVMLSTSAVAYFNLDMASMGLDFGASASPSLKSVIIDATRYVTQPVRGGEAEGTVHDAWLRRAQAAAETSEPRLGDLGGGSDHVGFYGHLAIPSASIGGSGAAGHSYHSNYETLAWYRRFVGDDYASARMVTQVTSLAAARLANAPVSALDVRRHAADLREHLAALTRRARALGLPAGGGEEQGGAEARFLPQFHELVEASRAYEHEADLLTRLLHSPAIMARQDGPTIDRINRALLQFERSWLHAEGVPGRPWYRNTWAAPDEDSGYGAWMLPLLRAAVERGDAAAIESAVQWYTRTILTLRDRLRFMRESLAL